MSWLRKLTMRRARRQRYGTPEAHPEAYAQLEHELEMIEELGFPGYFLVVYDIVTFCRDNDIYCQGRGSAANSAVCYALRHHQRRRGEARAAVRAVPRPRSATGRPTSTSTSSPTGARRSSSTSTTSTAGEHTAQVANVISYRPRSAVRDMAKAFGYSPGPAGRLEQADRPLGLRVATADVDDIPAQVVEFANELQTFPRHLGIHSGGMVICDRPVIEVCPVEWARMPDRTVLQWDKDDCAAVGLVKFDLLGLGHALGAALRVRHDRLRPGPRRHAAGRPRGLRHAVPGRLGRGVPGGEPGADGHPAPAASRASSTTWWSRWR